MKITHNKVGQNLNVVDGMKSEKMQKQKVNDGAKSSISPLDITDSAKVDVSERAKQAQKIKEIAMSAPEVDQDKVEKFRKLIDEGKYTVDAKAVAEKMVDEHLNMKN